MPKFVPEMACGPCYLLTGLATPAVILAGQHTPAGPHWLPICQTHLDGWWEEGVTPLPSFRIDDPINKE